MKIKALLFAFVLAIPSVALAQGPQAGADQDTAQPATKTKISDADKDILGHVHQVNVQEIEAAKLAQRSGTSKVKDLAKTLLQDHQASERKVMAFAKQHKIASLPRPVPQSEEDRQMEQQNKEMMTKLRSAKGEDFDRQFVQMMMMGHQRELAMTDPLIGKTQNAQIQSMLRDRRDVLQKHLEAAQKVMSNMPQARAGSPDSQQPSPQPTPGGKSAR